MEIILLCISNVKIKEGVKLTGYQLPLLFIHILNKKLNKFRLITVTIQEIGYRRYSGKQLNPAIHKKIECGHGLYIMA